MQHTTDLHAGAGMTFHHDTVTLKDDSDLQMMTVNSKLSSGITPEAFNEMYGTSQNYKHVAHRQPSAL